MSLLKILLVGIFGIMAVMIVTAMLTLIAPYAAALVVLSFMLWLFTRGESSDGKDDQQK